MAFNRSASERLDDREQEAIVPPPAVPGLVEEGGVVGMERWGKVYGVDDGSVARVWAYRRCTK